MDIKRVDDRPMLIHTKEKPKIHAKGAPEAKIRGENVLAVRHGPKAAGAAPEEGAATNGKIKLKKASVHVADKRKTGQERTAADGVDVRNGSGVVQGRNARGDAQDRNKSRSGDGVARGGNANENMREKTAGDATQGGRWWERDIRQSVNHEIQTQAKRAWPARYRREKEAALKKKSPVPAAAASVAAKAALDEMEGGKEVSDASMAAYTLAKPVVDAADAGRRLYRSKAAKERLRKIKKKKSGSRIGKKDTKTGKGKAAGKAGKTATKKTAKNAGTAMDRGGLKNATRSRMIRLFVEKLRQENNQDGIGKALKDIAMMRFAMVAKVVARYVGVFLLSLFAVVALVALPIVAVIAVIYNSPFAIFFPSISSGETIQEVLSGYVSDFNNAVNAELTDHAGYDGSEKIYVDYEGAGESDNFCDVLMAYMVKHGDGDTATDMTDAAKQNLKAVFDDMCSYTVTSRTDTETDDEGNETTTTVKEVNVKLKSCYDMVSVYGFNAKQEEVLAQLMDPQYLAMLGYAGGGGGGGGAPGAAISPEQYQAVVDAISDANGRNVVAFALSKVGYPYSQAYRDSGNYYDCSSLAYYAWQSAGVSIMYEGSNTAASEGKYCYDNNLLVEYDAMQPGDLIFYSYERNGRFMDISHVAVYVGDGKVVEAANSRIGVVYRPVQGRSSIVFIGRPR